MRELKLKCVFSFFELKFFKNKKFSGQDFIKNKIPPKKRNFKMYFEWNSINFLQNFSNFFQRFPTNRFQNFDAKNPFQDDQSFPNLCELK